MVRLTQERVLVIGDLDRQVYSAVVQALPKAFVRSVPTIFDGIAELNLEKFSLILAAAEPIDRRPGPAIQTLRQLSTDGRIVLFGDPTLEPASRKMLDLGCDDYLVTPVTAGDLTQSLSAPVTTHVQSSPLPASEPPAQSGPEVPLKQPAGLGILEKIDLARLALEVLAQNPPDAPAVIVERISVMVAPAMKMIARRPQEAAVSVASAGISVVSHPPQAPYPNALYLTVPQGEDNAAAKFLADLADQLAKVQALQDRQSALRTLATTDDLTGLHNARYFRHFLSRIIEKARQMHFPVTLFLFDIDNFKLYNDKFGHSVGDDILKQTASLMRRCVRDHDLVARIGGDEFAVVFWEKEGPRQPRDPSSGSGYRTAQKPQQILDRFRKLLAKAEFPGLGPEGLGSLTISGGLAVFPWNAMDAQGLIDAADKQLMFGAKRSGRNCIYLVGGERLGEEPNPKVP